MEKMFGKKREEHTIEKTKIFLTGIMSKNLQNKSYIINFIAFITADRKRKYYLRIGFRLILRPATNKMAITIEFEHKELITIERRIE